MAARRASQRGQSGERLNFTLFSAGVNTSPRGGMRQFADGRYAAVAKDVDAQYKALKARLQNEARDSAHKAWAKTKKEARYEA